MELSGILGHGVVALKQCKNMKRFHDCVASIFDCRKMSYI